MCQPCWMCRDWRGHGGSRWASVSMRQRLCGVEGDSILSPNTATAVCVCVCVWTLCVCMQGEVSSTEQPKFSLSLKSSLTLRSTGPRRSPWAGSRRVTPQADISNFTSHCWPALARSRIQFGHPVVREATSSPVSPSSPPPDLK